MTVRATDATVEYPEVTALDGVSLSVDPGELVLLAGPNGGGKTTFLDVVSRRLRLDGGSVDVEGDVGRGFQEPRVFDGLTVDGNARLFDCDEDVLERLSLDRVGHQRAGDLSTGTRKKLDVAAAFAGEPDVLVLDEPLADLDDVSRAIVTSLVSDHVERDGAALVATHRIREFEGLDRVVVLVDGAVEAVLEGDAEDVHRRYVDLLS
ncbi:MAG: ATP-binding cassette domain-containing protein [Halobacteriales archaeon]